MFDSLIIKQTNTLTNQFSTKCTISQRNGEDAAAPRPFYGSEFSTNIKS